MKKVSSFFMVFILTFLFVSSVASAHVTVWPKEAKQGSYEKFTVRVPSEEESSPTVKVELRIPAEVAISRVEPKPGWSYEISKDDTGAFASIAWTAEGEGLSPTEFTEFNISGKVSDTAETIVWKAYQTYGDGTVVEWIGAADSEKPASITKVIPGTGDAHGHDTDAGEDEANHLALYLSIAALALAAASFVVSLRKKA